MLSPEIAEKAKKRIEEYKELQRAGLICLDGQFFPSVHYPPITMYQPMTDDTLFKGYQDPPDGLFIIYAHIPFCIKYCSFCHYPNLIGDLPEEKDKYLNAIEKEMDIYMRRLGVKKIRARSILVVCGTPTYLSPAQLERFLKEITSRLDMSSCTQFNYDVDPTTLLGADGKERMRILKSYGVDRLTIGLQSLNDNILKHMNRHHNAEEAMMATAKALEEGFQVCIEFIFGYKGETLKTWVETIEKAVSLGVEEIQLYRLKVIPYGDHTGLILKKFSEDKGEFPGIDDTIMMKEIAIELLARHGYHENLTRVFTKAPEFYSHYAHGQCCNLVDQIGFGITAFHSLRDRFGLNTQSFKEYYSAIEELRLPINRGLVRTTDDRLRWHIILPLKNRKIYKAYYLKRTGVSLDDIFRKKKERLKSFGLVYEDEKIFSLTTHGRFFADEVCQQFHHPDHMPFPPTAYAAGPLNPYNDQQP